MNLSAEFEKWGRTLVIENTDSTQTAPFKGFIQPLRYKNKMYLYGVNTEDRLQFAGLLSLYRSARA